MIRDDPGPVAEDVAAAVQLACLLEASAPKPGNVSPGRPFRDTTYEDFLASAAAIGPAFSRAGSQPIGRTVRDAVDATRQWTRSNTNLGLVLALAPLARAAAQLAFRRTSPLPPASLRDAVRRNLQSTTVDDARDVFAAIRLAAPGGLGRAEAEDVAGEPTRTLLEVMELAARRDGIAREYATAYETTFQVAVPVLRDARLAGLSWNDAIVETFVTLLADGRDTHIVRRGGAPLAARVQARARAALAAGSVRTTEGQAALEDLDRFLRDRENLANPGTTADLTAAGLFVWLATGGWRAGTAD